MYNIIVVISKQDIKSFNNYLKPEPVCKSKFTFTNEVKSFYL